MLVDQRSEKRARTLEYELHTEASFMTTAGQIAVVLFMLALLAGGSLICWVLLFRFAAREESSPPRVPGASSQLGGHV